VSGSPSTRLYDLLPTVYRLRDASQGWPLRALLDVIQAQADRIEGNIDQLYDDFFIETCAEWVVPYIGDLLGVRPLAPVPDRTFSLRSFVGNTLAYRRRKGTALVLERLSQDITRWPAVAVEYFQLLGWTQHLNHLRLNAATTANIAAADAMRRVDGPFDSTGHTFCARRISRHQGKHNIPNVGIFLWRLQTYPLELLAAKAVDPQHYRFDQLGRDIPLFNPAKLDPAIETRNAETQMPSPLLRRPLHDQVTAYRKSPSPSVKEQIQRALKVYVNGDSDPIPPEKIVIADLSTWGYPVAHLGLSPSDMPIAVAVDPELGRLAFPRGVAPTSVRVSYSYGFSSEVGGGPYDRSLIESSSNVDLVPTYVSVTGGDSGTGAPKLQAAVDTVQTAGESYVIVEIGDSEQYRVPVINVPSGRVLELRSKNLCRPLLVANGDTWNITLGEDAKLRLSGLLVSARLQITCNTTAQCFISHSTLVPGEAFKLDGTPVTTAPSIVVAAQSGASALELGLERTISGPVSHASSSGRVVVCDSAIDGLGVSAPALAVGTLVMERSTVLGATNAYLFELVSDSVMNGLVYVERTQEGCVRFSYLAREDDLDSKAPRRFRCQPATAVSDAVQAAQAAGSDVDVARTQTLVRLLPQFTSTRFGVPGYLQLARCAAPEIVGGASNESEMGVFNHIGQTQRLANLDSILDEYLRVGLDAGVFLVT
jgi:hypothetical protein